MHLQLIYYAHQPVFSGKKFHAMPLVKERVLNPQKKTGRRRIKTGVENWSDFVKEHAGQTLVEMSQLLPISKTTLHTRLVQAGLSYKKNNNVYRSRPTKARKVLTTD